MPKPLILRGFDPADFIRDHWQRQPLLLRGALSDFSNPLDPDELAGLALEPEAESRLVLHRREDHSYLLEHGPFPAERFAELPERDWTLLVQAVDQWSPEVAALIEPFRALVPDWRIDDVMVSYAATGGGVGPHYDHYDVFLVQGLGQRRWRIGPRVEPTAAANLETESPLRLMSDFPVSAEYLLEPGDILYVPPGWGHWGEAESGDCMTYSVGLRAPDQAELIGHWADRVLAQCSPFDRYVDPSPDRVAASGPDHSPWLDDAAVEHAFQLMRQRMSDRERFAQWLGEWLSEPKYPEQLVPPAAPISTDRLAAALAEHPLLNRHPGSRLLLQSSQHGSDLCADGHRYPLRGEALLLAQRLCALPRHGVLRLAQPPNGESLELLTALYNQGSLEHDDLLEQEVEDTRDT